MMADISDMLAQCARMRGVARIPHRTIHEWAWFVEHVLQDRRKDHRGCMFSKACRKAIKAGGDFQWINDTDTRSTLERWATMFHVYWMEAVKVRIPDTDLSARPVRPRPLVTDKDISELRIQYLQKSLKHGKER